MTIAQFGVLVLAICSSAQNSTSPTGGTNSTSNPNATTMAPDTYSSSANSTTPTGAGVSLRAGTFSFLIPVVMAASLLQRYCWSPDQPFPLCLNTPPHLPSIHPTSPASLLSPSLHGDHKTNRWTSQPSCTPEVMIKKYVIQDNSFNKGGLAFCWINKSPSLAPCMESKGMAMHPASLLACVSIVTPSHFGDAQGCGCHVTCLDWNADHLSVQRIFLWLKIHLAINIRMGFVC